MTDAAAALPLPGRVPRAHGHPPPLRVWFAAAALFALVVAAIAVAFEIATPMPTRADLRFFRQQIASLHNQEQIYRTRGQDPISIVFLGTSRMKNVTMNSAGIAAQARAAGVARPVASTFFAIDWGGFERLSPEMSAIEKLHPDAVVMMPEFFTQDFNWLARLRFGLHFLQARTWGKEFLFFGDEEYAKPACVGFAVSSDSRHALNDRWMTSDADSRGPSTARSAAQALASQGVLVIAADVPTTGTLAANRAVQPSDLPNGIHTAWIGHPFAKDDYCDLAHIKPSSAGKWQAAFFQRAAPELNALR